MKTGLAVAAAMVVMTGCGNSDTKATTAAGTTSAAANEAAVNKLNDEAVLELGEYKGLLHTVEKEEITDGKVEARVNTLANQYPPEITDRAAKLGDTAKLDFEGTMDGESFEGGTSYGYKLELGSGTFIAGFEEQIVDMMPGTEKDVEVTFPEDYYNAELAGKDAVFHVKLHHVTNPEFIQIDDALAKRVTYNKDMTLDQWKGDIRQQMEINAEVHYYLDSAAELLEQVVANSKVEVDPDAARELIEETKAQYTAKAMLYGMDYKSFLMAFMNTTPEQVEIDLENSIKEQMVMEEIIRVENIQANDEQKEMIAKINGCNDVDHLVESYGEEQAEKMYGMYAGTYFLIENAFK